ncbi:MAG: lipoate--protein ligase family protein [Chlamydiae bacterium]|nr:lipoate--protein ligase family protein [Chlamydiota bacterium]
MLHILHLKNIPIWEQLALEEALLRTDERNFFILNEGSPRAIIMGISGQEKELIHPKAHDDLVPIFRRFSGGGTVIVDENTLFTSWIAQKELLPHAPFPEKILQWTASFYQKALEIDGFSLKENDYAIHHLKCGGNAQYLRKDRWLHHTTFLWDFTESNMNYLLHPPKIPLYRQNRSHLDFLCRLKEFIPSKELMVKKIIDNLEAAYLVKHLSLKEVLPVLQKEHRKTLQQILRP